MTDFSMPYHMQHYLDVCDAAKEEPHPEVVNAIRGAGAANNGHRLQLLEHLGEMVNQQRDTLHKAGLYTVLDALYQAGYQDQRIFKLENHPGPLTPSPSSANNGYTGNLKQPDDERQGLQHVNVSSAISPANTPNG